MTPPSTGVSGGASQAPIVEAVNPKYQPPPGTTAQIEQIQRDIDRVLAARAAAEQRQARADAVHGSLQTQKGQIQQARQNVAKGITATQAHDAEVERRKQLNTQRQAKHEESGAGIQDAASQLTGIATLETLLAGWTGFTGLVLRFQDVLPDSMVSSFHKMDSDGKRFSASLLKSKIGIQQHQAQLPAKGAEIAQTHAKIEATGAEAKGTQAQFAEASGGAAQIEEVNAQHSAFVAGKKTKAAHDKARAGDRAQSLQEQRDSLAARMQAWATEHKAARQAAVEETAKRMEGRGLQVTHRPQR